MTWQAMAGPSPSVPDAGPVTTMVRISDGVHVATVPVPNDGTLSGLTNAVKALTAARDAASGQRSVVAPGTVLDLTTPAAAGPTQAQIDRANWFAAYSKVLRLQRGVASGLSAVTAQNVTDAQTVLNALVYDPSYEDLL